MRAILCPGCHTASLPQCVVSVYLVHAYMRSDSIHLGRCHEFIHIGEGERTDQGAPGAQRQPHQGQHAGHREAAHALLQGHCLLCLGCIDGRAADKMAHGGRQPDSVP